MRTSCIYIPNAPNGKPSELFRALNTLTKDRDVAKRIWAFTKTDIFKSEFSDLAIDDNGEPTLDAVLNVMSIKEMLERNARDKAEAISLGIMSSNGSPAIFDTAEPAYTKAMEFNKKAQSMVAVISDEKNQFKIELLERSADSIKRAERDESNYKLNKGLVGLLNRIGFNMSFVDNPAYHGLFSPSHARKNAKDLKDIILISKDKLGYESLPEETAHLVLAGLNDDALKQRIDADFTEEKVRRILGDNYSRYYREYSNKSMPVDVLVREEAEAQVLSEILKGNMTRQEAPSGNLFARLWRKFLEWIGKLEPIDVDNVMVNPDNGLYDLDKMIKSGEVDTVLDRDKIMNHPDMKALNTESSRVLDILQEGEALLAKRLSIIENTGDKGNNKLLRKQIEELRNELDQNQYQQACERILGVIGLEIDELQNELLIYGDITDNTTDLSLIDREAGLMNRISSSVSAYYPYIQTLKQLPELIQKGYINLDPFQVEAIISNLHIYQDALDHLHGRVKELRFNVLKQLVSLYYGNFGEAPEHWTEAQKAKWESVEQVLTVAKHDISWWDTNLFSAGDSRNPLLNVIHNIISRKQATRNNKINKLIMEMQAADEELRKLGYENKFIYAYDENGKPTGYYEAPVDMYKYEKERELFVESVNANEELDYYEKQQLILEWDREHTEEVAVGEPKGPLKAQRVERIPKKKYYENKNFQKGWSQAQKDYYQKVINMKAEMDSYLPVALQNLYLAPQVRKSLSQAFDKDGRGAFKTMMSRMKQRYSVVDDNQDYGKNITVTGLDGKKVTLLDFEGKPIKRVPVYYVHKLENREDMSTDGTRAISSYIAMAVNYHEMNELANSMRLMQDYVREDYQVTQTDAGKPMIDMFRAAGQEYVSIYKKAGEGTNVGNAINTFIDRTLWNDTKRKLGNIENPFNETKPFSKDAIFNIFLRLTSVSRMGLNILSGITNVTQGESQIITEAISNRYFNLKDFAWSKKEYSKLLIDYMGQFNSANRHDKMYLLINQFNSSEDFFHDMQDMNFNKSAMKRVMGRGNIYFLNTMGEHMLHTTGMLMVLKHEKVKVTRNGKTESMSLYDAIKTNEKGGWHLELDGKVEFEDTTKSFLQGIAKTDGKIIIDNDAKKDKLFENLAVYINNINAGMHGGYSEVEKGNVNQQAIWRLILQFRQWMFGMYNKAYSRSYYDAVTQTMKEGGYMSIFKFIGGTIHDMKNMSIKAAIENNHLTPDERKNAAVALGQTILFVMLGIICKMTLGWKNEDDRYKRLLAYSALRLRTETGAFVPGTPLVKNIFTLIQSPAAGIKTLEGLSQILDINNYWDEINAGRYKGWTVAEKAIYTTTPLYNIQKLIDMKDYNYMFNIFN